MKRYILELTDDQHHDLKLNAAMYDVTIKKLIQAAIAYYLDELRAKAPVSLTQRRRAGDMDSRQV